MIRLLADLTDTVFLVLLVLSVLKSARVLMGKGRSGFAGRGSARKAKPKPTAGGDTVRDPVCGMFVSTELSHRLVEGGKVMHFCSEQCLHAYQKSAAKAS